MGQQVVVAGAIGLSCWAKGFARCMARRVSAARIFLVTYGPSARSGFCCCAQWCTCAARSGVCIFLLLDG